MKSTSWFYKIVISVVLIATFHYVWNYSRIQIDGLQPELCSLIYGEDSRYSSGFSHRAFNKIRPGMTKKQVLDLVGEPLQVFLFTKDIPAFSISLNQQGYKYCVADSDTNYRLRIVYFYGDIVTGILKEYYYD